MLTLRSIAPTDYTSKATHPPQIYEPTLHLTKVDYCNLAFSILVLEKKKLILEKFVFFFSS